MLRNLINYLLRRQPYARLDAGVWAPVYCPNDKSPGYLLGPFTSEEACRTFCRLANREPPRVHYPSPDEEMSPV